MFSSLNLELGKSLVVGVSGGPDSLALLHVLRGTGYPVLVASFNHRLRPEAEADVTHVQALAAAWGLSFVTDSADVAAYAAANGLSVEEAARELRYRFLFRAARQAGAQAVAVGHTADDQAETVLMHFLRGAGISGLKGMLPRVVLPVFDPEIPLVRPLLGWTRAQTEAYCRQHNLPSRTDSSNADTAYFRNRLRHELLPLLEAYNPQIRAALTRTARALQGDLELLEALVDSTWDRAVTASTDRFTAFDLAQLGKLSPGLRRNLIRRAAFALKPGLRDVDFDALERAASLNAVEVAGGLKTLVEGQKLYLTDDESALPVSDWPQVSDQHPVVIGQLELGNGWVLTSEQINPERRPLISDQWSACLDAGLTERRLWVRPFRAGDRFEPLGMPGMSMKLSNLFVNLKIPKRLRKHWPVVCLGEEIAWIPGLRMGHTCRLTDSSQGALLLSVKRS
jgi:tRNA(Ile)-lysidine synthase